MKSKLKNEPVFLGAALCLFFPAGLFFLVRSELKVQIKWLLGTAGLFVFTLLLSLAFFHTPSTIDLSKIQLHITRETLTVGQSGGFVLTDGATYRTDYTAHSNDECISLNGSAYTAIKPGKALLTVSFEDEIRTIEITVQEGAGTDTFVLASPSSERYHSTNAKHAGKKAVTMTEEEALRSGKTPCKTCF